MSKQLDVMNHYFAGDWLTVGRCYALYHTHDLRRINSRINAKLAIAGNKRIEGKFEIHSGITNEFKTYRLVDIEK